MPENSQSAAPQPSPAPKSALLSVALLLIGAILGAGGSWAYGWLLPRPAPEIRTVMSRFILPTSVGTCKQVMALAFRAAGFPTVTPDPGEEVGIGASGDRISAAAMCMPALGAATVAVSGVDQSQLMIKMQNVASAVAATNFAPAQPRR